MRDEQIEKHRLKWSKLAKENGWFKEPFFIKVWIDENNNILDSVSFIGMEEDIIIKTTKDDYEDFD